jgi:hypothetical protein
MRAGNRSHKIFIQFCVLVTEKRKIIIKCYFPLTEDHEITSQVAIFSGPESSMRFSENKEAILASCCVARFKLSKPIYYGMHQQV